MVKNSARIKGKIYVFIFLTIFVALLLSLSLSYYSVCRVQREFFRAQMRQTLEDRGAFLEEWLARRVAVLEMAQAFPDRFKKEELFSPDLLLRMGFSDIYRGWESGAFQSFAGWVPPPDYRPASRPWYRQTRSADALTASDPYLDPISGLMTITLGIPIESPEDGPGVMAGDIQMGDDHAWLKNIEVGEVGFLWLINDRGVVLQHPRGEMRFKVLRDFPEMASLDRILFSAPEGEFEYTRRGDHRRAIFRTIRPFGWVLGVTLREDEAFGAFRQFRDVHLALMVILLTLLGGVAWLVARSLGAPLARIITFVEEVASGNLEATLKPSHHREIDSLTTSLRKMGDRLREDFAVIGAQKEALALINQELESRVQERTEELERANEELRTSRDAMEILASTDYLTGLLNRRAFWERASQKMDQSPRGEGGIAVFMADLDGFKAVNDRYGHAAGDEVLRRVAEALRKGLREDDLLGRVGGEEFAFMVTGMSPGQGEALAEDLRKAVGEMKVPWHGEVLAVTMSVGVASRLGPEEDLEVMLARADRGLYEAKARGKNRVCPG